MVTFNPTRYPVALAKEELDLIIAAVDARLKGGMLSPTDGMVYLALHKRLQEESYTLHETIH